MLELSFLSFVCFIFFFQLSGELKLSGIGLYFLLCDWDLGPEVLSPVLLWESDIELCYLGFPLSAAFKLSTCWWPSPDSDLVLSLVSQIPLQLLGDLELSDTQGPNQELNPRLNQDLTPCL